MAHSLPPIDALAKRLMREVYQATDGFSRAHRYGVGEDLRRDARVLPRLCNRAWRDRPRQRHWTEQLVWAIDEVKIGLQLAKELHAFRGLRQFEALIRLAEDLGRQAGAWKRAQQHPKGQSSPAAVPPAGRAQTLSTRAASASAGANR
jgi:hypothetical protein